MLMRLIAVVGALCALSVVLEGIQKQIWSTNTIWSALALMGPQAWIPMQKRPVCHLCALLVSVFSLIYIGACGLLYAAAKYKKCSDATPWLLCELATITYQMTAAFLNQDSFVDGQVHLLVVDTLFGFIAVLYVTVTAWDWPVQAARLRSTNLQQPQHRSKPNSPSASPLLPQTQSMSQSTPVHLPTTQPFVRAASTRKSDLSLGSSAPTPALRTSATMLTAASSSGYRPLIRSPTRVPSRPPLSTRIRSLSSPPAHVSCIRRPVGSKSKASAPDSPPTTVPWSPQRLSARRPQSSPPSPPTHVPWTPPRISSGVKSRRTPSPPTHIPWTPPRVSSGVKSRRTPSPPTHVPWTPPRNLSGEKSRRTPSPPTHVAWSPPRNLYGVKLSQKTPSPPTHVPWTPQRSSIGERLRKTPSPPANIQTDFAGDSSRMSMSPSPSQSPRNFPCSPQVSGEAIRKKRGRVWGYAVPTFGSVARVQPTQSQPLSIHLDPPCSASQLPRRRNKKPEEHLTRGDNQGRSRRVGARRSAFLSRLRESSTSYMARAGRLALTELYGIGSKWRGAVAAYSQRSTRLYHVGQPSDLQEKSVKIDIAGEDQDGSHHIQTVSRVPMEGGTSRHSHGNETDLQLPGVSGNYETRYRSEMVEAAVKERVELEKRESSSSPPYCRLDLAATGAIPKSNIRKRRSKTKRPSAKRSESEEESSGDAFKRHTGDIQRRSQTRRLTRKATDSMIAERSKADAGAQGEHVVKMKLPFVFKETLDPSPIEGAQLVRDYPPSQQSIPPGLRISYWEKVNLWLQERQVIDFHEAEFRPQKKFRSTVEGPVDGIPSQRKTTSQNGSDNEEVKYMKDENKAIGSINISHPSPSTSVGDPEQTSPAKETD